MLHLKRLIPAIYEPGELGQYSVSMAEGKTCKSKLRGNE